MTQPGLVGIESLAFPAGQLAGQLHPRDEQDQRANQDDYQEGKITIRNIVQINKHDRNINQGYQPGQMRTIG